MRSVVVVVVFGISKKLILLDLYAVRLYYLVAVSRLLVPISLGFFPLIIKRVLKKSMLLVTIWERSLLLGVGLLLSIFTEDLKPILEAILLSDYRFGDCIIYYLSFFLEFFPLLGVGGFEGFDYLYDIFPGDLRCN